MAIVRGGNQLVSSSAEIFTSEDHARITAASRARSDVAFDEVAALRTPGPTWSTYLHALGLPDLADRARVRLPADIADVAARTRD
ncbi:hypothetical protein GTV32_15260 [Gordonia sp. SID5947]|uniref:hypothetical protein n=1 Tax=Gordonia sp. SID5947 TaxID=2690315 RepID=UPI00136E8DE4|nr:hypothetical protein [Gordonia sp. SID5947]MYR07579.1 hypothetical protein [Gordonia sp. SID5947]